MILSAISVSASTGFAEDLRCVLSNQLYGYTVQDDTHLVYNGMGKTKYMFNLSSGCNFHFADYIGFRTFSSFQVCRGDDVMTYQREFGETGRCMIESIDKN